MEKFLEILQGLVVAIPAIVFFFAPIAFLIFISVAMIRGLSKPVKSYSGVRSFSSSIRIEESRLSYKYRGKAHIMTRREEEFFRTLNDIFDKKCYIIPQVHLSALLNHKVKGQNWKGAFAHINGKSVDYVLLRSKDLSVLCAVELDDSTHDKTSRIERDREVERLLNDSNIPLVRLRNPGSMSKQEIVDIFAKTINEK